MTQIKLKLKENHPNSPQKYSIVNKIIVGYKIPRTYITKDMTEDFYKDLQKPGVYILIGKSANRKSDSIYIGQSDNVAQRLYAHKGGRDGEKQQGKTFWKNCIAFVTSNNQLQKGHTEFLEVEFYNKAFDANRYVLENDNAPCEKIISDWDRNICNDFFNDCHLLASLMGVPLFTPPAEDSFDASAKIPQPKLISNKDKRSADHPKYVYAFGHSCANDEFPDEFVVHKGSIITSDVTSKASPSLKRLRNYLIKHGYIKEIDGKLKFTNEYTFKTSGIAASIVLGRSASAKEWK